jgi:hypothetical protein
MGFVVGGGVALMKPAINSIENFHSTFPENKPVGVIPKLIVLLGLILRWDPDPSEIVVPLRTWIQVGFSQMSLYKLL